MAGAATSGKTVYTKPSDTELVATRVFDAPSHMVFDAHTKAEHLKKWMQGPEGWTMANCEIDLRPGGKWRVVWQDSGEKQFEVSGQYREVDRPDRFVQTERSAPDFPETVHIYEFIEKDGKTTMKWTVQFPSKEIRDNEIATGMTTGMEASYDNLDTVLQES